MPSVGALARRFEVDRDTIKTWSYKFSDYFSSSANPPKGHTRLYNEADLKVLAFIAYWYKTNADSYDESDGDEEIYKALQQGEHLHNEYVLLNIPVFQDTLEENEDWTHGVIIGGFATYNNKLLIAQGFKEAGDALLDKALNTFDDRVYQLQITYPMLYAYRHSIELYLKTIVQPKELDHDLKSLADALELICQKQGGFNLPLWVKERLYEFDQIDPDPATSFRYDNPDSGGLRLEHWVEWHQLRLVMGKLCQVFEILYHKLS